MLSRITSSASDLELLLDQLNSLEAGLDDSLLAPPAREDPEDTEARKARRAAKRAARRARATTAAVSGAAEATSSVDSLLHPRHRAAAGPASTSSGNATSSATSSTSPSSRSGAAASNVQQLEELFKLTVMEPELPRLVEPQSAIAAPRAAAAAPPGPASITIAPSVLKPRKVSRRVPAAAPVAPPAAPAPPTAAPPAPLEEASTAQQPAEPIAVAPVPTSAPEASSSAATAPPAPAPAAIPTPVPAAPAHAHATEKLTQKLERLFGAATGSREDAEDADLDSYAGPSEDDLHALEREVAALGASLDEDQDGDGTADAAGARQLEASALVARAPAQVSVMPAGPSLLSLVSPSATQGVSARSRQARRSARSGHGGLRGGAGSDAAARARALGSDGTNQFLHNSSTVTLLSQDVEREVTEVTRDFLFLEKVKRQCLKTLNRKPTVAEVAAAVGMDQTSYNMRYQAGLHAKELLMKSNYRLVVTVCKKYVNANMQLQDLVSEGLKGLLRAAENYDVSKGFRFGTYAHWWIRQSVLRSLAQTSRAVRLPNHMIEQLGKLKTVSGRLSMQLNREPTLPELAEATGFAVERIELLMEAARAASSMEAPVSGIENGGTIKDSLQDDGPAADDAFGSNSLRQDMEGLLAELPEREATVLRLRFGLEDGVEWTLEDIGDQLGVTRERIRQVEAKALRKLQVQTVAQGGKLGAYSTSLDMLAERDLAARASNGTRKT